MSGTTNVNRAEGGAVVRNLPAAQETQETQVRSLEDEDHLEEEMQPVLVFLPEKFYEQRSLGGYCPWGLKSQTQLSN